MRPMWLTSTFVKTISIKLSMNKTSNLAVGRYKTCYCGQFLPVALSLPYLLIQDAHYTLEKTLQYMNSMLYSKS